MQAQARTSFMLLVIATAKVYQDCRASCESGKNQTILLSLEEAPTSAVSPDTQMGYGKYSTVSSHRYALLAHSARRFPASHYIFLLQRWCTQHFVAYSKWWTVRTAVGLRIVLQFRIARRRCWSLQNCSMHRNFFFYFCALRCY